MSNTRNYEEYRAQVLDSLGEDYTVEDLRNFARWRLKVLEGLSAIYEGDTMKEKIIEAVDDWLDDHPEATTTVEDGAIATAKLASSAVTTAKIADGAITDAKLASGGIKAEVADIRVGANGTTYPNAGDAVRGQVGDLKSDLQETETEITSKMVKHSSNNLINPDTDLTDGYVGANGTIYSSSTYVYTKKIPVSEGDVVESYGFSGGTFHRQIIRFITAYDGGGMVDSSKGDESSINAYTVPSGVSYVVLSIYKNNITQKMVVKNYTPTAYEPYFAPYYTASEDFVAEALDNYGIPTEPVKGTNLINAYETGVGFYDKSGGKAVKFDYSSFRYAIIPVKKNTIYYLSSGGRTLLLTDDSDNVLTYFNNGLGSKKFVNTGEATKMFYTGNPSDFADDGTIIAEGLNGSSELVKKPSFVSGLTQRMALANYGCALPKVPAYFTVGINETLYTKNIVALNDNIPTLYMGASVMKFTNKGFEINVLSAMSSTNGYGYSIYDKNLALIDKKQAGYIYYKADNLQNASALVIGDSTVAQLTMTQKMLDGFTSRNKVLTLLGTRGTAPNKHEGRAGWSAKQYCTVDTSGGVSNPFFNPTTQKFDFSYYMTNQGYSNPDFVIIQLGINDLYGGDFANTQSQIEETASYIIEMIESILAYNSSQKILLNLPTAVNEDMSKHTQFMPIVRNKFVRYNEYMQILATQYAMTNVRCSYCHLILNPEEDIRDDVHPTSAGYEKMANEVISQINCWQN